MADFTIRSDSVDVEQIMQGIRNRIREKRGVDYTEQEVKELATVKLEKFLDPRNVRSDLAEHYRREHPPVMLQSPPLQTFSVPAPGLPEEFEFEFDEYAIYRSSRSLSGRIIELIRKILNPLLKLFFNPTPLVHALNCQIQINRALVRYQEALQATLQDSSKVTNAHFDRMAQKFYTRDQIDGLNFEVLNNLVLEMTKVSIEVKNMKMRVESLASRVEFDERRARALEGAVQYKPAAASAPMPFPTASGVAPSPAAGAQTDGPGRSRRRRRRGKRRPGEGVTPSAYASSPESLHEDAETADPADHATEDASSSSLEPAPDDAAREGGSADDRDGADHSSEP